MLSVCLLIMLPECVSVLVSVRTSATLCAAVMEGLISMTVILKLLPVGKKQTCLFATLESAVSSIYLSIDFRLEIETSQPLPTVLNLLILLILNNDNDASFKFLSSVLFTS